MRVLIITDAPTMFEKSLDGRLVPSGSYRSVATARATIEGRGHDVDIRVILDNRTVLSEEELLKAARSSLPLANAIKGQKLKDALDDSPFDALLITVTTDRLKAFLPSLFEYLNNRREKPILFVGAGRKTKEEVLSLSHKQGLQVRIFEKPGVARITSKGLGMLLVELGTAAPSLEIQSN